ncbi:chemotaxis protein CheX [Bacillus sp. T33-2]|uniref:chemotaxis protein CheX n=1 Tax=Bacillus sp. T33-2 TaxID=2054168 RepID=UPI000C768DE6|nr:chemotaxis protein CheX [Bacillus sp. T33-2]PLR97702.1 chemotaxis protein CheX [Bacillus sp. T33-2]
MITTEYLSQAALLESVLSSLSNVVPAPYRKETLRTVDGPLHVQFGVLIGITGQLKGKLIFKGPVELFGALGESMFGMPLEGEMLKSFAGELGNMISGGFCAKVFEQGISIDITSPTIMEGDSRISGFKAGHEVIVSFDGKGPLSLSVLFD